MSPESNKNLRALTVFCAAGYGLVTHPGMFAPDLPGMGAAVFFGLFLEVAREACMLGGRMIDTVAPPAIHKISKSPALLMGFGLCAATLFYTPIPEKAMWLGAKMRQPVKEAGYSVVNGVSTVIQAIKNNN